MKQTGHINLFFGGFLAYSLAGQGFAEFPSGPGEAVSISDHILNGGDNPTAILIGEGKG